MVSSANQQVSDLVRDHPSEQLAVVDLGYGRQCLHAIGEDRGQRARLLSKIDE